MNTIFYGFSCLRKAITGIFCPLRGQNVQYTEQRVELLPVDEPTSVVFDQHLFAMRRGIQLEPVVFTKLQAMDYDIEKSSVLYTMDFPCSGRTHTVFGRVDGVIRDKEGAIETVVEIKNRMHRFFIPEYDIDQLAAYVMMTDAQFGMLVQMYEGEVRIKMYTRNALKRRWNNIVKALPKAIEYMDTLAAEKDLLKD